MTLTLAQTKEQFAQALSQYTGLDLSVARAWSAAEVGVERKSLGTGGASGPSYATPQLGARAAADLINSSSLYAGIRTAIKTGDANTQATAIAQSPWHLGEGLKRAGGTDPYYKRIFSGFGLTIGGSPSTSPAPKTSTPGNSPVVNPATGFTTGQTLGAWGNIIGFPEGHVLTQADVDTMLKKLDEAGYFKSNAPGAGDIGKAITRAALQSAVGQPWNKGLQDTLQSKLNGAAVQTGDALDPTKQIPNVLGFAVGKVLLIVGGGLCVIVGVWIVLHEMPRATDPALLKVLQGGKGTAAVA